MGLQVTDLYVYVHFQKCTACYIHVDLYTLCVLKPHTVVWMSHNTQWGHLPKLLEVTPLIMEAG